MFEYKNVEYRNLQEQVLKNKEEIARHWNVDRVLADFGITVLGRVDTYDDIKDLDEGENWGYGYLVGTAEPYTVYVWTRPNLNVGEPDPYWLNIGSISIVGPEGPRGRDGGQGPRGWSIFDVRQLDDGRLLIAYGDPSPKGEGYDIMYTQPLKGPQGIQGVKGEKGLNL